MTGASNQNISYTFSYDSNNRLTGVTDSNSRTLSYQYDLAGNRTSMTFPENLTTTYTYNDAGRLTGIVNFIGSFGLSYDNAGRRTGLTYPNGTSAIYTYDANSNLTRVRHLDSGLTAFSDVNYTYNNLNNRSVRTDTQGSASYTYDANSRLTVNSLGENYSYDGVGNRLTGPLATDTMTYDAGNEQLNINSILFTYDLNGNRTQKTDSGTVTTYTYDDENRLVQVTVGSDVITYAYDPFGRRIVKTINGVTTSYVYDQSAIIAAYDGSGNVIARYTHGLNIDEPLAVQQGTVNYFHHADGLGSIVALTNSSGSAVQTYSYDAFGNTTISDGITQPYAYTAREYDTETGLYFYRARYYDPKVGRFVTKDPIGFGGGDVNLYGYVSNDPVNWRDSAGLSKDKFVPDPFKHGDPHIDRYNPEGQNTGRYRPDGSPIEHKGKCPDPISKKDMPKFLKAVEKLLMMIGGKPNVSIIPAIILPSQEQILNNLNNGMPMDHYPGKIY